MRELTMQVIYGNEVKTVQIYQPNGAGDQFQILIDRYYQGIIMKLKGEWVAHLNNRSELTSDDLLILFDLVDTENASINRSTLKSDQ